MANHSWRAGTGRVGAKNHLMPYCIAVCCLVAMVFVYMRGQDLNYDLLNYHYYAGYSLLHGRYEHDIAAAGVQSFFNPIANVIAYLSLKNLPFPFSGWLILAIQLLSVPALILIGRETGKALGYATTSLSELLALLLCLISPLWWSELGTTFFSSWTAPLILWAFYLLTRSFSGQPLGSKGLGVAGVMLGFAVGLKLTNAPFAVAAFVALLYMVGKTGLWKSAGKKIGIFAIGGIAGFAATAWWNWILWSEWQSPIFPLYNAIFKSPYFKPENVRDGRFIFSSTSDFLTFIIQAAFGSIKTSEVAFADARLLFISALVPAAVLCKPAKGFGEQVNALMLFVLSGFALWATMLAYQRYLIPLELLLGLVVWILLSRIVERERVKVVVLTCLVLLSFYAVRIPDWGHAKVHNGAKDPLGVQTLGRFAATPGQYLVAVDTPISYIFPSLHADSVFYGIGVSKQIEELISRRLKARSSLPLRVIAKEADAPAFWRQLKNYDVDPSSHELGCSNFTTIIGRYVICEIRRAGQPALVDELGVDLVFSEAAHLKAVGMLWERGFSGPEPWGRWSDGELAEIGFSSCLPHGNISLSVTGRAFGPNVGQPIGFLLGDYKKTAMFDEANSEVIMKFVNDEACTNKLVIQIPRPTSPAALGLSKDPRKLGLGLVRLRITKD